MRACLDVCCPVPIALVSPLSSDVPLRTAAFGLEARWLLWSRARLYADRMELTGWGLGGRYHRSISLGRIGAVEPIEDGLILHLTDGSALRIEIDTPREWADALTTYRDVHGDSG